MTTVDLTVTNASLTLTANQSGATYTWLDCNNGNSVVGNLQSYTATVNGDYAVEITFGSCVNTSARENITGVGIKEITNNIVSIYPNPSTGLFRVNFGNNNSTINYSIISVEGKVVKYEKINANTTIIDLSNESKGIYFVKITDENNIFIKKLVLE
ncbi:MAG: hypothetical protein CO118_02235 [Flavobacteriales bacterium CG_4_9_14_3_um_filter_32_8]|nr:MAG: hypothetical protein CO118_02235 [Flavobacteriales bacterium CG_4_9_14_3_um_filter_32_8]